MAIALFVAALLILLGLGGWLVLSNPSFTISGSDVVSWVCGACGLAVAPVVIGIGAIARRNRTARCSRCGTEFPFPRFTTCPECGADRFRFLEDAAIVT